MAGASINPVDWKLRSGALKAMMPLDLPAVLGRDASGEVVDLGPGVTSCAKRKPRVPAQGSASVATLLRVGIACWGARAGREGSELHTRRP